MKKLQSSTELLISNALFKSIC